MATSYAQLIRIIEHPAFRIGFLDAQNGAEFDHDDIMARIRRETPPTALARIGWNDTGQMPSLFSSARPKNSAVELAQYRYEEGRLAVVAVGLRCKAWGHPDYPPAAIRSYIGSRVAYPASVPSFS